MHLQLARCAVALLCATALGARAADTKTAALEIKFTTPKRGDITRFVSLPGSVRPLQQAMLYAKVPGYLKAISVDKGDAVQAGALLAEIAAPELLADRAKARAEVVKARADIAKYRADIAKATADVARACADVAKVNADLPRAKADADIAKLDHDRLHAAQKKVPDLVTQQSVDAAKAKHESAAAAVAVAKAAQTFAQANVDAAQANVTAAQAALEAAQAGVDVALANQKRFETLIGFTKISAPFAGIVTARSVDLGAFIPAGNGAGSTPIVTLMDFSTVRVQVAMTELEAPLVAKGQPVKVSAEGFLGRVFEGGVTRFAYALDDATKTMLVEAELPNPKLELRPGMYATVRVGVEKHLNALLVPVEAHVLEKSGAVVFILTDGKAKKLTAVKLGFNDGNNVEIVSGLAEGAKVLLVGKLVLTDGQAVNVVEGK